MLMAYSGVRANGSADDERPAEAALRAVTHARAAQGGWARTPIRHRLAILRRLRHAIEQEAHPLAASITAPNRDLAQRLASEVLPLADAIRFLERRAARLLAPAAHGFWGRPLWLAGCDLTVTREPLGVVLIVAPSNYPLLLSGVGAAQALAAGNAIVIKPAPGHEAPMRLLRDLAIESGIHPDLFCIASGASQAVNAAIEAGVDKVVLTGSAPTGRAVLARCAEKITPAIMELSGCDATFVLPDADLDLAARAIVFGLTMNGSATCIAPRRCFVPRTVLDDLEKRISALVEKWPPIYLPRHVFDQMMELTRDAVAGGARVVSTNRNGDSSATNLQFAPSDGELTQVAPLILSDCRPTSRLLNADLFAPVLAIVPVADIAEAERLNQCSAFSLGATIFGPAREAQQLAARLNAGAVVINDAIAPTADPRLPFGGRGQSGFGATRGAEGLLEMTRPKAVSTRKGRFRPHFQPTQNGDDAMFRAYLLAAHGRTPGERFNGVTRLVRALIRRPKHGENINSNGALSNG